MPDHKEGEGHGAHGWATEVTWDGGRGRQPYANQGAEEQGPVAAETEAGDRGAASGRNYEQQQQVLGFPVTDKSEADPTVATERAAPAERTKPD